MYLVFLKGNGGLKYCLLGNEWILGIENVVCDVIEGLDVIVVVLVVCCLLEGIWGVLGDVGKVDVKIGIVLGFVMFGDKVSVFMIGDIVVFLFF